MDTNYGRKVPKSIQYFHERASTAQHSCHHKLQSDSPLYLIGRMTSSNNYADSEQVSNKTPLLCIFQPFLMQISLKVIFTSLGNIDI